MARRNPQPSGSRRTTTSPSPAAPRPSPEPDGDTDTAAWLGERTRRLALGLTATLITARAYWPSEPDFRLEAGTGLDWVLAILLVTGLAVASALIGGRSLIRWSWTDAAVIALMLLVGLSARHAADRRPAINLAWEWAGVGLAYLLVRNLPRTPRESAAMAGVLAATATAVAVYGLYQVGVELPTMRAEYQRNPAAMLRQLGIEPGTPAQSLLESRLLGSKEPWSTFALPNSLAGFLVGPLVLMVSVWGDNLRRSAAERARPGLLLLLALGPILAVLACLLLTKSRSAYVGLGVALAVLAVRSRRLVSGRTLALTVLGGGVLVAALVAAALATKQLDRLVLLEAPKSLRYRWEYWVGAWRVINESTRSFWSGRGPGNFAAPYLRHKLPQASEEIVDPHNMLLEVWATAGIGALVALLAALGFALRDTFGPPVREPPSPEPANRATRPADPSAPPPGAGWLVAFGGLGWAAVVLLGRLNPFAPSQGDLFERWLILGVVWLLTVMLGAPLWRRQPIAAWGLGAAALAVMINLLAAGGIGIPTVALGLWTLIALGLNLRDGGPSARVREAGGRLSAFAAAAVWSALIGTMAGSVGPFWEMEHALAEAEAATAADPPDYRRALAAYDRAARSDRYSARPWLGLARLEYGVWRARGAKPDDLRWKKVPMALVEAVKPPRSPDVWTLHRERATIGSAILRQIGDTLSPTDRIRLQGNVIESLRRASTLYPSNATLHAQLAEASAEIGMTPDAVKEAREALRLDELTPHLDKKLAPRLRRRLKERLPGWEAAAPPTAKAPPKRR